ncbi:MAG TPA: Uma2 family endonuclease [Burkholderiales bacterium]|nr:Uma2 family endonuclease [Burkholderiales bacterium]
MVDLPEVIEGPLSGEELAVRYRALCDDPCYANVPGKIELDLWGRMLMSPASVYHGLVQGRLVHELKTALGGETIVEAPVVTAAGLLVVDVAWSSQEFMAAHGSENPLRHAPEICVEVVSPSNSVKELREKIEAYLRAAAKEAWIVYPQSKRCEFHGERGVLLQSAYRVDLTGLFA